MRATRGEKSTMPVRGVIRCAKRRIGRVRLSMNPNTPPCPRTWNHDIRIRATMARVSS